MRVLLGALALGVSYCVLLIVPASGAQQPPAKIDIKQLGPQIGEKAPDFELEDQSGKKWSRDTIMGPKGAMLVFFRSADW